ncbi:hypothetical protein ABZ215_23730 [Amycolatopsis sp. NPDC006131]|uniref:hypothetical protein n=1 Tax=Amycolatopsis sp. NPDC006131 TaxID=3156731 RepID=UPI0033AD2D58
MAMRPHHERYEPVFEHLRGHRDMEPIDPAKGARVLLHVAEMDEPPLHLVLGSDGVEIIRERMAKLVAEDAKWAALGRSVDFDAA